MSSKYTQWCRENGRTAHCARIAKEHVGWGQDYPNGTWHKGDLSTSLMLWVEAWFNSEDWSQEDPMLVVAGMAAAAINKCLRKLYNLDAWLEAGQAREVAEHGLTFLRRYSRLARDAHQRGLRYWVIMPKIHALHHIWLGLLRASAKGQSLSPLCLSVQQDEDFIGRGARLSRHVSVITCEDRMVSRYLQACYAEYVRCGYLVRAK
eukprot:Skav220602  [mRNA]  locus=scaffold507:34258:34875:- [translate_table: standard]